MVAPRQPWTPDAPPVPRYTRMSQPLMDIPKRMDWPCYYVVDRNDIGNPDMKAFWCSEDSYSALQWARKRCEELRRNLRIVSPPTDCNGVLLMFEEIWMEGHEPPKTAKPATPTGWGEF